MGYLVTAVLEPLVAVILDDAGYVSPRRTLPAAWTGGALMAMAVLLGSASSADAHTGAHYVGSDCDDQPEDQRDGWCSWMCSTLQGHSPFGAYCLWDPDWTEEEDLGKCNCKSL